MMMQWWLKNEARAEGEAAARAGADTLPLSCCERYGVNCSQGRACPVHAPQAAAAATEIGAGGDAWSWLDDSRSALVLTGLTVALVGPWLIGTWGIARWAWAVLGAWLA